MTSFDDEPRNKRVKYNNSVNSDNLSTLDGRQQNNEGKDGLNNTSVSLKVENDHEMIDSEIIQHQRVQEEQEKAAEEARQKEYINESDVDHQTADNSLDHHHHHHHHENGDDISQHDQDALKDASHSVNSSLLAATATAALARSSSAGPDSMATPPQHSMNMGQTAATLTSLQSHPGLSNHHQNMSSNSSQGNLDLSMSQFQTQPSRYNQIAKPTVGTEEWHRQRRDNHKEVERRRRETINDGIRELSELVPNCEKNKGQILRRAVEYIRDLKANEAGRMEKWTMDKILSEQAISEVSASNEKLKAELKRTWREVAMWKKACTDAGIKPPEAHM